MLTDQTRPSTEETPPAATEEREQGPSKASPDSIEVLQRVDRLLSDIRSAVDTAAREQRHKPFSPWRWVGAVVQVFAAGLVALSVLDWVFGAAPDGLLVKLAFACVLQLGALTAFVVSERPQ